MRRLLTLLASIVVVLSGPIAATALARTGPPPPDATPGAPGVSGPDLGAIELAVAPGYRLEMVEAVFAPGAYVTPHSHAGAILACVESGALGFAIQAGAATVTRGATGGTPAAAEPLALDTEVVLRPGDCLAFDEFAAHTIAVAWNASDGETVFWEAHLAKVGEPFTTFVDALGTPVPVS